MVYTYSVIIQNQETLDIFSKYKSLFSEAIGNDKIGICKWNESGSTIDQALPEIRNLTDDKDEWNAIIVRYKDGPAMASFECDKQNPYDFALHKEDFPILEEEQIPLIRLTHMLGEIPAPEVTFKPQIIHEEYKAPRTIYTSVLDLEAKNAHDRLNAKFKFIGKAPKAIYIVSIREDAKPKEIIDLFNNYRESQSSEFWKRNHYSSKCKFLVYDFVNEGSVQREADDLKFWITVLLLSINDYENSVIQSCRLYNLDTYIDKNEMEVSFQELINKLNNTKYALEQSLRKSIEKDISEKVKLPEFRLNIPIKINFPRLNNFLVKKKSFPFLSNGASDDLSNWESQCQRGENFLIQNVRTAERALDQTADRMRIHSVFDIEEVNDLNTYQEEDMILETQELYHEIHSIQDHLPDIGFENNKNINQAKKSVEDRLRQRVCKRPVIYTVLALFFIMAFSLLPAVFNDVVSLKFFWIALIVIVVTIVLVSMVVIICQKIGLNDLIKAYNRFINDAFDELIHHADNYSRYYSAIVSYSRGASYLNLSSQKKHSKEDKFTLKSKNIKSLNVYIAKVKTWGKAFHLNVDYDLLDFETKINISPVPEENKYIDFYGDETYPLEINSSGMMVETPFKFAKRIEIVREELYEDESH